jgi:GT2 family glycosyltransferase
MSDPRVAVVILTHNQCEMTLECLEHVLTMEAPAFYVVLWDNGSWDGTVDAVQERYPSVLTHWNPDNLGVASGRNAAASLALERLSPSHLLFLDNDVEVEPGFLAALLDGFSGDPAIGQTQAKLRFFDDRERLNDGGGCRISFWRGTTSPVGFNEIDRGQRDRRRPCIACGGAMLTRADVFRELGGFDSEFDPVGPEDLDYSLRLQDAGYEALYVPEAVGYHRVSHTFGGGRYSEEYAKHKARNWLTFLRRHGSPLQKIGFFCVSAPLLVLRLVVREGRQGNFRAIRGMLRGLIGMLRGRGEPGGRHGAR